MESKFIHRVSKGSRFNQIYIPREYEQVFQEGDIVEIRLVEKKAKLYYSKNLKKLSEFKEKLIKDVFYEISNFKEIDQVFIFGSFLTKNIDYNDIDLLIISEKEDIDKKIYHELTKKLNLKFHLISIPKESLNKQIKIDPLIRSMFYYCVSNKKIEKLLERELDEKHIRFLLMFPEDLIRVSLDEGKVFYDVLRKLIAIEHFLKGKDIAPDMINEELEKLIDKKKLEFIKENNPLDKKMQKEIGMIIKEKINLIYKIMKNGKNKQY